MLILPGCEQVVAHASQSAEWHAARRKGIGGSDASIILGENPWTKPKQLWELKTGRRQPDAGNTFTRFGTLLEDSILERAYYGHATPGTRYGSMRSKERPHMLANIDGVYDGCLIEIKTTGKRWTKVPDYYVAQVRHYLYVTGLTQAEVIECYTPHERSTLVAAMDLAGLSADKVVEHLCKIERHTIKQDPQWLEWYLFKADVFWKSVESDTWDEPDLGW